jgi:hypothetical protein
LYWWRLVENLTQLGYCYANAISASKPRSRHLQQNNSKNSDLQAVSPESAMGRQILLFSQTRGGKADKSSDYLLSVLINHRYKPFIVGISHIEFS